MPRIDDSIVVKAPRDKVFAYISDVSLQPEWVKWSKDVTITSLQQSGLGTTDASVMQVGPQKQRVEGLITEYKPGEYLTRRLTSGMELTERIAAVPFEDGTKVAYSVEYKPPMGPLGQLVDFLFMQRLFEQLLGDSLTNLKQRLEAAR